MDAEPLLRTHMCPGPRCKGAAPIPYEMLMCRADWYAVPRPIRNLVYRTWANGAGAGSEEHGRAMRKAIEIANRDWEA